MLNIQNVTIQFAGRYLFDNVSFSVGENDRIGLIGRNGTGKSTMLKLIYGLESPESGKISIPNNYKLGYLPQEIKTDSTKSIFEEAESALDEFKKLEDDINGYTKELEERTDYESDEYMKIIERLTEASDVFHHLGGQSIEAEIEKVLIGLGFERSDFTRGMDEFSGGWQMRVHLAKILLRQNDCILLDEPTNHLDIESIRWLEVFLKSYQGAIMVVSHDKRFLDNITNRTIEFSLGKIYDLPYPYSRFVAERSTQKELQLAAYNNQQKQIAQQERFIERFKAKAAFSARAQSKVKQLEKMDLIEVEEEDLSKMRFSFPEPPRSSRLIFETKNLIKRYDRKLVLSDINFEIERGEKVCFVGKNGEGKSTLSKILAGMIDCEGILEKGANLSIGYFSQHQAESLDPDATVFETIDRVATGEMRKKIRSMLGAFLFSGNAVDKKVRVLSGGEKSRLSICKMLFSPINVLILDEPTNHFDMLSKDVLKNALLDFKGTMIIVSHDREFLQGITTKTYEFKKGKIREYIGDINEFLAQQQIDSLDLLETGKRG
ncbi:MAG: ABC-F family ATP-binding cassette domain-containing protein [Candidatus Kapabacteria bacterium]|nr:ABC-F family ATP-binding cassette domain-containing protein [Ignavibacteriota bacterium]MCW5883846.1 ABC-F family ATP-binding cassette domain-containing protein [Candidatus Kapabacteria bacterium]